MSMVFSFTKEIARCMLRRKFQLICYVIFLWTIGFIISNLVGRLGKSNIIQRTPIRLAQPKKSFPPNHPKLLRTVRYCNYPDVISKGDEGRAFSLDDLLEMVVIVTRHGDRGPLQEFRNLSQINCGVDQKKYPEYFRFLKSITSFRRQTYSSDPFVTFPYYPLHQNLCMPGQLTQNGVVQHIQLGQFLRNAYVDRWHLIPPEWKSSDIIVYSTLVARTYQSAIAFLHGFLPGFDPNRLRIWVGMGLTFCHKHYFCSCALLDNLRTAINQEKNAMTKQHPAVYQLSRKLGEVLSIYQSSGAVFPEAIFDRLMTYMCHDAPLPCKHGSEDEADCATVERLNRLMAFLDYTGKQIAITHNFKLFSRLQVQGFLTDILQKFNNIVSVPRSPKVVLYSGHDVTLVPLLTALGVFDGAKPPLSSRLVFELYSSKQIVNSVPNTVYHLRIIYNGKDVTRQVTFCSNLKLSRESAKNKTVWDRKLCVLQAFETFVNMDYLMEFDADNFQQACNVKRYLKKEEAKLNNELPDDTYYPSTPN